MTFPLPHRARTTPGSNAGSFAPVARTEADVTFETSSAQSPVPAPRFDSLDDLALAGYVTDEWARWQQGGCGAYAIALTRTHPHLRFAVLGRTERGGGDASEGWSQVHFFAHDDTYAYDSAGRHPLPYRGIRADCDYAELDSDPDWYGLYDEHADEDYEAAASHADRHAIVSRGPIPFGGLRTEQSAR